MAGGAVVDGYRGEGPLVTPGRSDYLDDLSVDAGHVAQQHHRTSTDSAYGRQAGAQRSEIALSVIGVAHNSGPPGCYRLLHGACRMAGNDHDGIEGRGFDDGNHVPDHRSVTEDQELFGSGVGHPLGKAGSQNDAGQLVAHPNAMSCGRTGTRVSGLSVAARMAATTAGVELIVGGSPTPLAPKGPQSFGSSTRRASTAGASRNVGSR